VTLGELSVEQVENLIERAVDRRLRVWLDQVLDALSALSEEETSDLMSAVYVVRYIT
jgi:alpha-D-ribose 1-methylphosphonate 5-triphosphate synthase subunit PhnI